MPKKTDLLAQGIGIMGGDIIESEEEKLEHVLKPFQFHMEPEKPSKPGVDTLLIIRIALQTLTYRFLLYLGTIGSFVLYGYSLLYPDYLRFAIATVYTVTVTLPLLWRDKHG